MDFLVFHPVISMKLIFNVYEAHSCKLHKLAEDTWSQSCHLADSYTVFARVFKLSTVHLKCEIKSSKSEGAVAMVS